MTKVAQETMGAVAELVPAFYASQVLIPDSVIEYTRAELGRDTLAGAGLALHNAIQARRALRNRDYLTASVATGLATIWGGLSKKLLSIGNNPEDYDIELDKGTRVQTTFAMGALFAAQRFVNRRISN